MTRLARTATVAAAIGAMALLLLGAACGLAGIRVNTSKSIPLGLYRTTSAPIDKGAYVLFCPPPSDVFKAARQRGYIGDGICPGGYGYLMKRVAGAEGDTVTVTAEGVRVNAQRLPFSAPRRADQAGRPLPAFEAHGYVLGKEDVLLMSDRSSTSFDARYFGPVRRAQLETVIVPLLTW